jgi:hypothetical protein
MLQRSARLMVMDVKPINFDAAESLISRNLKLIEASVTGDPALKRFGQIVAGIKKVAPRSDEFIYFVCRAIHAMEAANIDPVSHKIVGDGFVNKKGMWESPSGKTPFPYVNQNGDAFPEAELLKTVKAAENGEPEKLAYHTFIGRGLFVNHASDDAEKIRGIILDATWDPTTKGTDLLVACDKVAYPELARQIQAGYSNDVSMGTQVAHSICSECGNVAKVEADYCDHIKTAKGSFYNGRPVYEANFGLNFIEISVVATGADPKAKIRQVLAHLNQVVQAREATLVTAKHGPSDSSNIKDAEQTLSDVQNVLKKLGSTQNLEDIDLSSLGIDQIGKTQMNPILASHDSVEAELKQIQTQLSSLQQRLKEFKGAAMSTSNDRKAYLNKDGEPDSGLNLSEQDKPEFKQDYKKVRDTQDKQMVGKGMEPGDTGMHPGYGESDKAVKERLLRAEEIAARKQTREALKKQLAYLNDEGAPDSGLNTTEQDKAEFKQDYKKVRDTQDKQMVGKGMESGDTGMHPGYGESDKAVKERLLRARLKKAEAKADYRWTVYAGEEPILEATAGGLYGETLEAPNPENPSQTNFQWVSSADYGRNLITAVREMGLAEVKRQIEAAQKSQAKKAPTTGSAGCSSMNKEDLKDQTKKDEPKKDEPKKEEAKKEEAKKEEAKKEEPKKDASAEKVTKKAQLDPMTLPTSETAPPAEAAAPMDMDAEAKKKDDKADVDVNIDVGTEDTKAGAGGLPAETAAALQEVADMLASAGEQLASLIGTEGELDEEAKKEATDVGEEVVEAGDELSQLDEAMGKASEAGASKEGMPPADAEKAAEAMSRIKTLMAHAVRDAKAVAKRASVFLAKHGQTKTALATRRALRRAAADKLYGITDGDMTSDAHAKGNKTAVPGHEVMTGHGIKDASVGVAEKNPTGKLTAGQKDRRIKVATFVKKLQATGGMEDLPQALKDNAEAKKEECKEECKAEEKKEDKKEDKKEAAAATKTDKKVEATADAESKSYYKELYNSDPAAKEFAADLTKDYTGKKAKAEVDGLKAKMHRAYKVALKQAKLGQIQNTAEAVQNQVETLSRMEDTGFDAFAQAVENTTKTVPLTASTASGSLLRTASAQVPPQGGDVPTSSADARSAQISDLSQRLSTLGWSTTGRR